MIDTANGLKADPILDRGLPGLRYFQAFLPPYGQWTGTKPLGHDTTSLLELFDAQREMDLTGLSAFANALRGAVDASHYEAQIQGNRFRQVGVAWPEGAGVNALQLLESVGNRAGSDLEQLTDLADAIDSTTANLLGVVGHKADVGASAFTPEAVDGKSTDEVEQIIKYARGDFGLAEDLEARQALVRGILPGFPQDGDPERYCAAWLNEVFVAAIDGKVGEFVTLCQDTDTAVCGFYEQLVAVFDGVDQSPYPTVQGLEAIPQGQNPAQQSDTDSNSLDLVAGSKFNIDSESPDGDSQEADDDSTSSSTSRITGDENSKEDDGTDVDETDDAGSADDESDDEAEDDGSDTESTSPTAQAKEQAELIQAQAAAATEVVGTIDAAIQAVGSVVDVGSKVVEVASSAVSSVIENISSGVDLVDNIVDAASPDSSDGGDGDAGDGKDTGEDENSGEDEGADEEDSSTDSASTGQRQNLTSGSTIPTATGQPIPSALEQSTGIGAIPNVAANLSTSMAMAATQERSTGQATAVSETATATTGSSEADSELAD